jgi:hypothetical protein
MVLPFGHRHKLAEGSYPRASPGEELCPAVMGRVAEVGGLSRMGARRVPKVRRCGCLRGRAARAGELVGFRTIVVGVGSA